MPQEEGTQGQIRLFGDSRFSFFVSYSWPHALVTQALHAKLCVLCLLVEGKVPVRFPLFRCARGKLKTVELPFSTDCLQFFRLRRAAVLHLRQQRLLCLGRGNYRASLRLWKSMKLNSLSLTTWKSTIARIPRRLRQHAAKPASCIFYQSRCVFVCPLVSRFLPAPPRRRLVARVCVFFPLTVGSQRG